jgi:hypothetical protein
MWYRADFVWVGNFAALTYTTYTVRYARPLQWFPGNCFCASHPITTYSYGYGKIRYSYRTTTNLPHFSPTHTKSTQSALAKRSINIIIVYSNCAEFSPFILSVHFCNHFLIILINFQFRTVLHQLLQRETTTTFHWIDTERGARRV